MRRRLRSLPKKIFGSGCGRDGKAPSKYVLGEANLWRKVFFL